MDLNPSPNLRSHPPNPNLLPKNVKSKFKLQISQLVEARGSWFILNVD